MNLTKSMLLTKEEIKRKSPWWSVLFVLLTFIGTSIPFGIALGIGAMLLGIPMEKILSLSSDSSVGSLINLGIFPFYLIIILLINKYFYKKSFSSLGFSSIKRFQHYVLGLGLGMTIFLIIYGINLLFKGVSTTLNPSINWMMISIVFIAFVIQGMTEEVLMRGFMMNTISSKVGVFWGILINSLIFAGMHLGNDSVTFLSIINIFIFGILFSMLFYWSDNLWLTGAAHSIWNFTMGPVLGIEVSGLVLEDTIFKTVSIPGKTLINGGTFGLEGGIVTTIVGVIGCFVLWFISKNKWEIKS